MKTDHKKPSLAIPWQRKAAYHQGQVVRILRQHGDNEAKAIAKEELRPWIEVLETLPDGHKAVSQ